jgi:secondary thiamine-phosphate synthase enzyme
MKIIKQDLFTEKEGFYNITKTVSDVISTNNITSGICVVFCPHTTAGITVNENADPDVVVDMLYALNKTFPDFKAFQHAEGNSAAHLKCSAMGCEKTLIIEDGKLVLGIWQGIYFCEFDGPKRRNYYIKVIGE